MKIRDAHVMWLHIFVSGAKRLGYDKKTFLAHVAVAWGIVPSEPSSAGGGEG